MIIRLPFVDNLSYGDDFFYMPNSVWIANHNLNPFIGGDLNKHGELTKDHASLEELSKQEELFGDGMHPPILFLLIGFFYKIFGIKVITHRIVILLLSAINLFFIYKIGNYLFNKKVGLIASLLVFFSPIYFAQSGLLNLSIITSTILSATVYYLIRKKGKPFLVFSSLMLLTNEFTVILFPFLFLYKFIDSYKGSILKNIKKNLIYTIPLVLFFSWIFFHYLVFGWFWFSSRSFMFLGIHPLLNKIFINSWSFLFEHFMWIPFLIILLGITQDFLKSKFEMKTTFIILGSLSFLYCIITTWILISMPFFYLGLLFYLLGFKEKIIEFNQNRVRKFTILIFLLTISSFFVLTNIEFRLRHILPFLIFFMIIAANYLCNLFKKYSYFITFLIIIIFISQYFHPVLHEPYSPEDFEETNLEYLKITKIYKESIDYLNNNYTNRTIVVGGIAYFFLKYPYFGYTHTNMDVIWPSPSNKEKFDVIYYNTLELEYVDNSSIYLTKFINSSKLKRTFIYPTGKRVKYIKIFELENNNIT